MPKPDDRPTIRVKPKTYNPTKAELEEVIRLPEGTTPEQVAQAVTRSVRVIEDPEA